MLRLIQTVMVLCCMLLLPTWGQAATAVGSVVTVSGDAKMERNGAMRAIAIHDDVFQSDVIITGDKGRVKLLMADNSKVYVGAKTRIGLQQYAMSEKGLFKASLDLAWGKARFFVNKLVSRKSSFEVKTSTAVLGVRGTGWLTEVVNGQTFVTQFEGVLSVQTAQGTFSVRDGQVASIDVAGAFRVRPATKQEMSLKQIDPDVGDKVIAGDEAQASSKSPEDQQQGGQQQDDQQQGDQQQGDQQQGDQQQGDQQQGDQQQGDQQQGDQQQGDQQQGDPQQGGQQQGDQQPGGQQQGDQQQGGQQQGGQQQGGQQQGGQQQGGQQQGAQQQGAQQQGDQQQGGQQQGGQQQGGQQQGGQQQGGQQQGAQQQGAQQQGAQQQGAQQQGGSSPSAPVAAVVPERPTQVIVPAGFTPVASSASTGSGQTGGAQGQQQGGTTSPAAQQGGTTGATPAPQTPVTPPVVQPPVPPTTVIQNAVQQTQTTVNITPQFVLP